MMKHLETHDSDIIESIGSNKTNTIFIVTDGGVYDYHGSFGLTISKGTVKLANTKGKLYTVMIFMRQRINEN